MYRTFLQYGEIQNFDKSSDAINCRQVFNTIHSGAITTFIDSLPVNCVLRFQIKGSSCKETKLEGLMTNFVVDMAVD